jgi:predicted hydrocarbon binding protein
MSSQNPPDPEFLGAAVNGLVGALLNRDALLADFSRKDELVGLRDDTLHPLSLYLDFCNYLETRLGMYAFLRLGRKMGAAVIATSFPKEISSVAEATAFVNVAHQQFCRPVVGAFEVTEESPGRLVVRYTAPYNCLLQEGLFYEVALRYGAPGATVTHSACRRKGADACRYEITY